MRPLPVIVIHDIDTPPLSPTSSVGSTNSPVTPIDDHSPTCVYDRSVSEGPSRGRPALFNSSSEVWEEFKDVGHSSSTVAVADPGILISPSSSLLSGLDLLGGAAPPPLPRVAAVPTRSLPRQIRVQHNESFLDFPSPPALVSNRRKSWGISGLIGKGSLMVRPLSNPSLAVSCDSIPQPTHYPPFSPLKRRWSALPPVEFYLDNRARSNDRVTADGPDSFSTSPVVTHRDIPVVSCVPLFAPPNSGPSDGPYDEPSPRRRPKRQEKSDPFESFIDMSVKESAFSVSRVHRLLSKISGSLKPRSKRHG